MAVGGSDLGDLLFDGEICRKIDLTSKYSGSSLTTSGPSPEVNVCMRVIFARKEKENVFFLIV